MGARLAAASAVIICTRGVSAAANRHPNRAKRGSPRGDSPALGPSTRTVLGPEVSLGMGEREAIVSGSSPSQRDCPDEGIRAPAKPSEQLANAPERAASTTCHARPNMRKYFSTSLYETNQTNTDHTMESKRGRRRNRGNFPMPGALF